jgi:hypothetical protein
MPDVHQRLGSATSIPVLSIVDILDGQTSVITTRFYSEVL